MQMLASMAISHTNTHMRRYTTPDTVEFQYNILLHDGLT